MDLLRVNKIERLEIILQNRYDRLLEMQTEIEEYLDTLKSDNLIEKTEYLLNNKQDIQNLMAANENGELVYL